MTVQISYIEERSYNLLGDLKDEQDCLESLINNGYDGDNYLGDAISEIADNYIPIYTNDIWENVADIQEYVEEAIASGLAVVEGRNVDLTKIFQAGYYQYYTQSLYDNLDTLAYNYIVNKVNNALNDLNEVTVEANDLEAIEYNIELVTSDTDNNDKFDDLNEKAQGIIEDINAGEYAKQE